MNQLKCLLTTVLVVSSLSMEAQSVKYSPFQHYTERIKEFDSMAPIDSSSIVMLGNSLTENGGDWNARLDGKRIKNRGISGDDAEGIKHRLVQILPGRPKAIFLMVGVNDLSHQLTPRQVFDNICSVIEQIRSESPQTRLFVQSLLPINESFGRWKTLEGKTDDIPVINRLLKQYCQKHDITYINLFKQFVRHGTNELRASLSVDGLHLSLIGYKIWAFELRRYIRGLE